MLHRENIVHEIPVVRGEVIMYIIKKAYSIAVHF